MALLRTVLAWLLAALTILVAIEGGLRVLGLAPHRSPVAFDRDVGWANCPSSAGVLEGREFTAHWRTDERGLRVTPRAGSGTASGEAQKVVLLGDSFVFGTAVDERDTIAARLQARWDREGRALVALNAGALGWDTGQAATWFEREGAALAPTAAVLFVYENDLYWNTRDEYESSDGARPKVRVDGTETTRVLVTPPPRPWWRGTAIVAALQRFRPRAEASRLEVSGTSVEAELAPLLALRGDALEELDASLDRHALAGLALFVRTCERLGAEPVLVTLPSAALFEPDWRAKYEGRGLAGLDWDPERPVERWLALADRVAGGPILALDATTALRRHREANPSERLFHRNDWHLAPLGNTVVADAVAAFLTDRIDSAPAGTGAALAPLDDSPWTARIAWWLGISAVAALALRAQRRGTSVALDVFGAAAMVALVFTIAIGGGALVRALPPAVAAPALALLATAILCFVLWHLRDRIGTIGELLTTFAGRGRWYLMPTLVLLIAVGSLLIVASSSPLVAPFVYTLF